MPDEKQERRAAKRVPWQLPASVSSGGSGYARADMRDISSRGLFFFTQDKVEENSKLEVVLIMPPEVEPLGRQWVCCHATVVRVEQDKAHNRLGVAAVIDRCEALPQI